MVVLLCTTRTPISSQIMLLTCNHMIAQLPIVHCVRCPNTVLLKDLFFAFCFFKGTFYLFIGDQLWGRRPCAPYGQAATVQIPVPRVLLGRNKTYALTLDSWIKQYEEFRMECDYQLFLFTLLWSFFYKVVFRGASIAYRRDGETLLNQQTSFLPNH